MTDSEYAELVRLLAEERERQAQAKGALAELERRLLEEFGLRTEAEARVELKRVERELAKHKAAARAALEELEVQAAGRAELLEVIRRLIQ